MTEFISGLDLNEQFFHEVVRPLLAVPSAHMPVGMPLPSARPFKMSKSANCRYLAALINSPTIQTCGVTRPMAVGYGRCTKLKPCQTHHPLPWWCA